MFAPLAKHLPPRVTDVIQPSFCVLDRSKSFWGRLMCIINPHSSSCFGKSVGSIKNIQRFRFPRLIPLIQLQGMETFRIQFVLQSWSAVILARDWECASRTQRERGEGSRGWGRGSCWHLYFDIRSVTSYTEMRRCIFILIMLWSAEKNHLYASGFYQIISRQVDLQEHEWTVLPFNHCALFLSRSRFMCCTAFCWFRNKPATAVSHPSQTVVHLTGILNERVENTVTHRLQRTFKRKASVMLS